MDYTEVTFDIREDGIATMTLNRPEKLNSFTRKMFEEWKDVVARCVFEAVSYTHLTLPTNREV